MKYFLFILLTLFCGCEITFEIDAKGILDDEVDGLLDDYGTCELLCSFVIESFCMHQEESCVDRCQETTFSVVSKCILDEGTSTVSCTKALECIGFVDGGV